MNLIFTWILKVVDSYRSEKKKIDLCQPHVLKKIALQAVKLLDTLRGFHLEIGIGRQIPFCQLGYRISKPSTSYPLEFPPFNGPFAFQ